MKNAVGVALIVFGAVLVLSAVKNQNPAHVIAGAIGLRSDPPDAIS